jgi:hypothetical protein
VFATQLCQPLNQSAGIAADAGLLIDSCRIVYADAQIPASSNATRADILRSLDMSVGPDAIDAEVPEQDHKNSYGLGYVVAQGAPDVKNQAVETQENGLIDDITAHADQSELDQLRENPLLSRFGKGPKAVPHEIAEYSSGEGTGISPELAESENQDQQVQQAKVYDCPESANGGEFQEALNLFPLGQE